MVTFNFTIQNYLLFVTSYLITLTLALFYFHSIWKRSVNIIGTTVIKPVVYIICCLIITILLWNLYIGFAILFSPEYYIIIK